MNFKSISTIIVLSIILTACASVPPLNFTPNDDDIKIKKSRTINAELKTITVSSAKPSEQIGQIQVGFGGNQYESSLKETLKSSLEESLLKSQIFNDDSDNKLSLLAKVMKLESPDGGLNFKTYTTIRYQLIERKNGHIVYDKLITSTGEIPFNYSVLGIARFHEARNISMRNNIKNFINDLNKNGLSKY